MTKFSSCWFDARKELMEKTCLPLAGKPITMMEIGVFEGKSTLWFLENILTHYESGTIVVDTFEGDSVFDRIGINRENIRERFEKNIEPFKDKVIIKQGRSRTIVHQMRGEMLDLVYIDGSHEACDVLYDALDSFRLLKKGGIMMFDDYLWTHWSNTYGDQVSDRSLLYKEPKIAIDAFLHCFKNQYELLLNAEQIHIKKI